MEEKLPKDFNEVLNGIYVLKQELDMTWMDAILEFCEVKNYRIEEVGFMLKDNKNFIKILEDDFIRNKHIQGDIYDKKSLIDCWC